MRLLPAAVVAAAMLIAPAPALGWSWPVHGSVLTFFSFDRQHPYAAGQHRGIDIGAPTGTAVEAPVSGSVAFAGTVPVAGKTVTIATSDGYSVTLVHLGSYAVRRGDAVSEGEMVGAVGASGEPELTLPYLHLGVRLTDDPQGYLDPLSFLPAQGPSPSPGPGPQPAPQPVPVPDPVGGSAPPAAPPPPPAPAPVPAPAPMVSPPSTVPRGGHRVTVAARVPAGSGRAPVRAQRRHVRPGGAALPARAHRRTQAGRSHPSGVPEAVRRPRPAVSRSSEGWSGGTGAGDVRRSAAPAIVARDPPWPASRGRPGRGCPVPPCAGSGPLRHPAAPSRGGKGGSYH